MLKKNLILVAVLLLALALTSCGTIIPEINLNHRFDQGETGAQTEAGTEPDEIDSQGGEGPGSDAIGTDTETDTDTAPIDTLPPDVMLDEVQKQAVCATLTRLAGVDPQGIVLTVVTDSGSAQLTSVYTIGASEVQYSVEKLNPFTIENGVIVRPATYKTTCTGTATVDNGRVISLEGDIVELPAYETLVGGFVFTPENFENVAKDADTVSFDVLNASEFWGGAIDAENMNVTIHFNPERLVSLSATYETGADTVTVTYDFQ